MRYINVHSHHKPRFENEWCLRNAYTQLAPNALRKLSYPVSVGLHPWHVNRLSLGSCQAYLNQCVMLENVLALGETGLDLSCDIPLAVQVPYFELHLKIAEQTGKPLVVHAVRTYHLFVPYLKKSKVPFIFHQFNGNKQEIGQLMHHSAYFSFGKNLFTRKGMDAYNEIPGDRKFLETDNVSHIHIADIYGKASELTRCSETELAEQLEQNYTQVFKPV